MRILITGAAELVGYRAATLLQKRHAVIVTSSTVPEYLHAFFPLRMMLPTRRS